MEAGNSQELPIAVNYFAERATICARLLLTSHFRRFHDPTSQTAVVLLPGLDGTGELFEAFAAALDPQVCPIIVRYPGDQILSYPALLESARAQLPARMPFVLLGESFSGPIAIALAASEPLGLVGVVLSCSFARNPYPLLRWSRRLVRRMPIPLQSSAVANRLLFGRHSTPELGGALRHALRSVDAKVLRARAASVLTVDVTANLKRLRRPVLYLRATDDRLIPASAGRFIQLHHRRTEVVDFAGPHGLLQARPNETAARVSEFALRCGTSPPAAEGG